MISLYLCLFGRRDMTSYAVYVDGKLTPEDVDDLLDVDFTNFVTFYVGCSYSFESALIKGGVPIRNIQRKKDTAMYQVVVVAVVELLLFL